MADIFSIRPKEIQIMKNANCKTLAKCFIVVCLVWTYAAKGQDWPMWGGSPARNNVAEGKIPDEWDAGRRNRETGKWEGSRNIKWAANLGSQTYGSPVVAGGRVFVGSNNGAGYLKRYPYLVDLGVLLCFRESDGKFLWQHSNEKLATGRIHDWERQGVCSTPVVDGNRLWYVSNRGEVVCLDTEGYHDGEDDGPEQAAWGRLFRTDAKMHHLIRSGDIPAGLREAFAQHDVPLDRKFRSREERSQPGWTIGRWEKRRGSLILSSAF
jgi:hypothetical protein